MSLAPNPDGTYVDQSFGDGITINSLPLIGYYGDCIDRPVKYTRFLGMAVSGFSSTMGWGEAESTCSIELYEDYCGDGWYDKSIISEDGTPIFKTTLPAIFKGIDRVKRDNETGAPLSKFDPNWWSNNVNEPPSTDHDVERAVFDIRAMIGAPYHFRIGQFEFSGILQRLNRITSEDGKEGWKAHLVSPKKFVDNIQLIISEYYGITPINNVYNLAAEIESRKLFYSQQNIVVPPTIMGSMYYNEIIWAFNKLQMDRSVCFKKSSVGPDGLGGPNYYVDLSELPGCSNSIIPPGQVPASYRITGPNVTLGEFVQRVCDEQEGFRLDYYWELRPSAVDQISLRTSYLMSLLPDSYTVDINGTLHQNNAVAKPPENIEAIQAELWRLANRLNDINNDGEYRSQYNSPIIKLKVTTKGRQSSNNVHYINQVIHGMQDSGVEVNNHSIGLEYALDPPNVLMHGAPKEILVNATGNTQSVWKMYFGDDKYNLPQIMDTEYVFIPEDVMNIVAETVSDGTWQYNQSEFFANNVVYLDGYELYAGLKFFVDSDLLQKLFNNENGPVTWATKVGQYELPEYLKVSESEIRAACDFDMFWSTVYAIKGDLYKYFMLPIAGPTLLNIMLHKGSDILDLAIDVGRDDEHSMRRKIANTKLWMAFADDAMTKPGMVIESEFAMNQAHEDFQQIWTWVQRKLETFYGKHFVTPFMFMSTTNMRDEQGKLVSMYEPIQQGFREHGGSEWMGLSKVDPTIFGFRGLETFTEDDGRIRSFLRFYDPLRLCDSTRANLNDVIRTKDYLYVAASDVKHIKVGNLVHVVLDQAILHYNLFTGPNAGNAMTDWDVLIIALNQTINYWTGKGIDAGTDRIKDILRTKRRTKTNVAAGYMMKNIAPKAVVPRDGCYGVKCNFIHYGPWTINNGCGVGIYESQSDLAPWNFGSQLTDSRDAHRRMQHAGMLSVIHHADLYMFSEVDESGELDIGGHPRIRLGDEIGMIIGERQDAYFTRHEQIRFGDIYTGIYGGDSFGDTYPVFSIDERPYNGDFGPNVTNMTFDGQDTQGRLITKYSMNKWTPKAGFLAKHQLDRLKLSTMITRNRTKAIMDQARLMIDYSMKVRDIRRERWEKDTGRRSYINTPHNILGGQMIDGTYTYSDPETGRDVNRYAIRTKEITGIDSIDGVQSMKDKEDYTQKAFVSLNGLFTPFGTTDVKDAIQLEIELARQANPNLTPAQIDEIIATHTPKVPFLLPHFEKPTNTTGVASSSEGPRFTSEEAIDNFNKTGILDKNNMVLSHPINGPMLNPYVNPASIDGNELMTSQAGEKSNSLFGHSTEVVSAGLTQRKHLDMPTKILEGEIPYDVHYRSMAHNAPMILAGWGFDTDGKPYPRDAANATWFCQDFAMRKDRWFAAPIDLRIDLKRRVWTIPTPRMVYCVMLEDMTIKDVSAQNANERNEFETGYDKGRIRGEQDRQVKIGNDSGMNNPPKALNARDLDTNWYNGQTVNTKNGYDEGYSDGLYAIAKTVISDKPNKIISGKAKVLNSSDGREYFINIETLSGQPLYQGEKVMAWRDESAETYYAIPTGLTMNTGIVMRDIEPTGDFDRDINELQGGGTVMLSNGTMVRVYAGMVQETSQNIPSGATIEFINLNGINRVVNRIC